MKPTVLIKTGGKVAVTGDELTTLITEIKTLQSDYNFLLVHGGGAEVTENSKVHGYETTFIDGIRMTTADEMNIVDDVLSGRINKRLVREFEKNGVDAVGLSGNDGQIFIGKSINPEIDNRTGKVTKTNPKLLTLLLEAGYVPLISSPSMNEEGLSLNINADEAALAVATALSVDKVIFISDIPGILKDGEVLTAMNRRKIEVEIEAGVISGGMIPKVNTSLDAIDHGVHSVVISNYLKDGDLIDMIKNKKGSIITQ